MEKLRDYLNSLAKERRAQFVEACGTSEGYLQKAISIGQKFGGDLCILIERESAGAVTCEYLRPDVDWAYLCTSKVSIPSTPYTRRSTDQKGRP
jgi:DNA-binding transcriptional regulator YdaS (Cro superfamily)